MTTPIRILFTHETTSSQSQAVARDAYVSSICALLIDRAPTVEMVDNQSVTVEQIQECDVTIVLESPSTIDQMRHMCSLMTKAARPWIVRGRLSLPLSRMVVFASGFHAQDDDTPEFVGGMVRGMLHRQPEIDRLQLEVTLAERCQGGLQTEISRIHEELQLAALVQREHLPREMPTLHGMNFGVFFRPANYVSGDIYDVSRLDEDHVGVFLADAVGHGVPAALLTMVISRSVRTKEIQGNSYRLIEPGEVLTQLNDEMVKRRCQRTRFATAVYALVNCRERTMRFAAAGHPPPFLYHPDGTSQRLSGAGGLLGVFDGETYGQMEVDLGVGDTVVMYSDGFEQAFPDPAEGRAGTHRPTDRYEAAFGSLAKGASSPDAVVDGLAELVDQQFGSLHQVDDMTMLCLHAGSLQDDVDQPTDAQSPTLHSA